ncbi:MAG: S-layer homology domain-containing protein [Clostridia bacterium]|nr:S-layer homology domain-containing protein [Clostridia bacterium]
MKKLLLIPIICALLLTPAASAAVVASSPDVEVAAPVAIRLSPALDVLATELTLTKTGLVSKEITFSALDFESLLGVGYLPSITVLTLPDPNVGTLYLETMPVMKNQVISRDSLSALKFVPTTTEKADCSFVFGTVSTSQPLALSCTLRLTDGLNFAPETDTVKTQDVSTLAGIPVFGKLTADDPEGDSVTYRVTAYPEKGTLRMLDRADGSFCYTPVEGYTGSDSFTYIVVDEYGNASDAVTVALTVEEIATAVSYCDMEGNRALLPAMRLAESGVMIGETIGASAYFHPEQVVTRAEFLAMTLCAAGVDVPDEGEATAFADDADIPDYLRRYVSYAAKRGYVTGSSADGTGYFEPGRAVTYAEAAVMLQSVLNLTAEGVHSVFAEEEDVPAWAESAVWAVAEAGLFPDGVFASDSAVNRADAAVMIAGVLERG